MPAQVIGRIQKPGLGIMRNARRDAVPENPFFLFDPVLTVTAHASSAKRFRHPSVCAVHAQRLEDLFFQKLLVPVSGCAFDYILEDHGMHV